MINQTGEGDVGVMREIFQAEIEVARATLEYGQAGFFRATEDGLEQVGRVFNCFEQCDLIAATQQHLIKEHDNDALLITRARKNGKGDMVEPGKDKCDFRDCEQCELCPGYDTNLSGVRKQVILLPLGGGSKHSYKDGQTFTRREDIDLRPGKALVIYLTGEGSEVKVYGEEMNANDVQLEALLNAAIQDRLSPFVITA